MPSARNIRLPREKIKSQPRKLRLLLDISSRGYYLRCMNIATGFGKEPTNGDLATPEQLVLEQLSDIATRLRETADALHAGSINPHHAANRLRRIANTIQREEVKR